MEAKTVAFTLDCGRTISLTPSQAVAASLAKAKRVKMSARISAELQALHPRLGSYGSQFAGWQGRKEKAKVNTYGIPSQLLDLRG